MIQKGPPINFPRSHCPRLTARCPTSVFSVPTRRIGPTMARCTGHNFIKIQRDSPPLRCSAYKFVRLLYPSGPGRFKVCPSPSLSLLDSSQCLGWLRDSWAGQLRNSRVAQGQDCIALTQLLSHALERKQRSSLCAGQRLLTVPSRGWAGLGSSAACCNAASQDGVS